MHVTLTWMSEFWRATLCGEEVKPWPEDPVNSVSYLLALLLQRESRVHHRPSMLLDIPQRRVGPYHVNVYNTVSQTFQYITKNQYNITQLQILA